MNRAIRYRADRLRTGGSHRAGLLFAAVAATALLAAGTPARAQKCEAGKNQASGRYAACTSKAVKGLVLKGDSDKYASALLKCSDKLASSFARLEGRGGCPTSGDVGDVEAFLDFCTQSVAQSLADGTPLPICTGPPFALPQTGETTSYGAGSDGDTQRGVARSFTDNGDGTITDNTTGLMWEKKSDDGSIHDRDNHYSWSTNPDSMMDGTIVTEFLATLNSGEGFAGYTDWRIPNILELQTLVDVARPSVPPTFSAFDQNCVPGCTVLTCSCTILSFYWSSTTATPSISYVHIIDFNSIGQLEHREKMAPAFPRAVRGGS